MIFVDTSFLVGLFVTNDQWHKNAKRIVNIVYEKNKEKVICNLIISEIIRTINSKLGVKASEEVYDHILDNYTIIDEDRKLYNKAMKTFVNYHKLSLADSVAIEIMKKLDINEIASFDSDFDNILEIRRIS